MNLIVIIAVMAGLFFGALLMVTGIFCWYLLKTIKRMEATVAGVAVVFEPLIKSGTIKQFADSAAQLVVIGRNVVPAMGAINTTVAAFNKAFFKAGSIPEQSPIAFQDGGDSGGFAKTGESIHLEYSEESAAVAERFEELSKAGFTAKEVPVAEGQS